MYVDLVHSLRCLTPHEDSWLVAVARRMEGRSIVEGTLGCPVCRREYPVAAGVGYFGVVPSLERQSAPAAAPAPPDETDVLRLAAFLGLESPGGTVVLSGRWSRSARALREIAQVSCVLIDPPEDAGAVGEGIAALRTAGAIPLASRSVRGVALDPDDGDARAAEALRVLGGRARLVAPARLAVPHGVEEMARDETLWVARTAPSASPPVGITRGARSSR